MTPEQLRASILQYAMQGKLTDQRPEDGSVDDLLAQIAAEKEQLILDKKIKRDKELPPISEDEVPFQIPANWKWVRLGDLYSIRGGKRIPKGWKLQDEDNGNVYLRVADLHDGTVTSTNLKYAPVEVIDKIDAYRISRGDLYVTIAGTIGRSGIIPDEFDNVLLTENAVKLMPILPKLTTFTYLTIESNTVQFQFSELTNAVAQPKLSIRSLNSTLIPLPPLAEQERIVDKIDMLETKINEYALRYEKIQLLDSELKPKLRESILYEIAAGKLNSGDTDNSPSSDTDTPFDVPVNWKWVTLSEIAEISLGKTPDSKNARYWAGGKFPWISISDMQNGKVSETTQKQITQAAIDEKMGAISPKGTLILSFKLSIGKVAILPTDMYHNEAIASIFIKDSAVLKEWLYVILPKMVQYAEVTGAVKGNTLNKKKLSNLLIPVPDLETQTKLVHVWSSVQNYI